MPWEHTGMRLSHLGLPVERTAQPIRPRAFLPCACASANPLPAYEPLSGVTTRGGGIHSFG